MKGRTRRMIYGLLVAAAILLAPMPEPAAQSTAYTLTGLGTLGGSSSYALAVNSAGHVVGHSQTAGGNMHAFVYTGGKLIDLGTLGGANSFAYAINDLGLIVGRAQDASGEYRPFLAKLGSPMFDLSILDLRLRGTFSTATGINNLAGIVGYYHTALPHMAARNRVFLARDSTVLDLGAFGGEDGVAVAINDAGHIAGYYSIEPHADYADRRSFLSINGTIIELGTLGGRITTATDLNSVDQVTGHSHTSSGEPHAFLYSGGLHDLGTLPGGQQSFGEGINDAGDIVGFSDTAVRRLAAFVYRGGTMIDLNKLIPAGSGWHLSEARDINNGGVVVGTGIVKGQERAFVLRPQN